ncbi:MnhB domain-containing protein [Pseudomonas aeruginosa]
MLLPLALLILGVHLPARPQPAGRRFIAGLVTAIALVLQYIASGSQWVEQRPPLNYAAMAGAGVLDRRAHRARQLAVRLSVPDFRRSAT